MSEIRIVLPDADEDALSDGLVSITEAIATRDADVVAHGFLGGEFGYGAHWDSDMFMMHPYCWCEEDDCPWCGGDASPFAHNPQWGPLNISGTAPNFWHKPSGLKVWWYKYIGRGMRVENPDGADVVAVLAECLESVKHDR